MNLLGKLFQIPLRNVNQVWPIHVLFFLVFLTSSVSSLSEGSMTPTTSWSAAAAAAALGSKSEWPKYMDASGGISSLDDIAALMALDDPPLDGAICGRALYDGRIDPASLFQLAASGR